MIPMPKLRTSIAARLVMSFGALTLLSIVIVGVTFYVGTIGVLDEHIDAKIRAAMEHLTSRYNSRPLAELSAQVLRELSDGVDSEHELYLLLDAQGRALAGNLAPAPALTQLRERLLTRTVVRNGVTTQARLMAHRMPGGAVLLVGLDLSDHESVRRLIWRALATGFGLSLLLTLLGAYLFRHQIDRRISDIRRTARAVGAGDMRLRIPITGSDEFSLLNEDINRMLDRIEQLMEGVRHVSNAIAHDLRTPLGRIRGKLDDALTHEASVAGLTEAAQTAIHDIDNLTSLFERLLHIAEAESGVRARLFDTIDLSRIAADIVEMYEPSAEEAGIALSYDPVPGVVSAHGDRHLLGSAIASLIDNAIKYAGAGAQVCVGVDGDGDMVALTVRDSGPGIPEAELGKVARRFYRLDKSRAMPGNGLGLSIVSATAKLHGGALRLSNAHPGLEARLILPRTSARGA